MSEEKLLIVLSELYKIQDDVANNYLTLNLDWYSRDYVYDEIEGIIKIITEEETDDKRMDFSDTNNHKYIDTSGYSHFGITQRQET